MGRRTQGETRTAKGLGGKLGRLSGQLTWAVVAILLPARAISGFPLMGLSTRPRGNLVLRLPLMGFSTRARGNFIDASAASREIPCSRPHLKCGRKALGVK